MSPCRLSPLLARAWIRSASPSAPGVTRTPGQRFRKPLLYPPELQGLVRGRKRPNLRKLGVVQQGLDASPLQALPPLQKVQLDQKTESRDCRTGASHELRRSAGRAPSGEHVVYD